VEALAARSGVGAGAFVVGAGDLVASAALAIRNITVGTQVGEGSAGLRRLRALVVGASERVHAALPLTDVAIRAFRGNEATATAGSSVYPCCACPRTATNLDTTRVPGLQAAFAAGSNTGLRALVVGASERVHAALPLTDVAIRAFRGNEATSTAGSSVYPCCASPRSSTNLITTRVPGLQPAFAAGSNSAGHRQERYQAGAQDHELDCRSCHGCEGAETGVGSAMEAPNL